MYSWNYFRLARPRSGAICLLGTLVASLAFVLLAGWLAGQPGILIDSKESTRLIRYGLQATCVVIGLVLTNDQSRAFRAFQLADRTAGRVFLPGVLAIAGNILVLLAILPAAKGLFYGASAIGPR